MKNCGYHWKGAAVVGAALCGDNCMSPATCSRSLPPGFQRERISFVSFRTPNFAQRHNGLDVNPYPRVCVTRCIPFLFRTHNPKAYSFIYIPLTWINLCCSMTHTETFPESYDGDSLDGAPHSTRPIVADSIKILLHDQTYLTITRSTTLYLWSLSST